MNRLENEGSAYLRHAAKQPVDWYPWSDEAFEKAAREGKPVFLSSGAVWCHWCHVMAQESFDDSETARLMNELFVNVKLDRDERPDIDRRYQQAVAAMGGGSGWPLSVFLTPDRKPFLGGTYFPPVDSQGRPGFRSVLKAASAFYRTRRDDAEEYARRVMATLVPQPLPRGAVTDEGLEEARSAMLSQFDTHNGGFGHQPKFPMPGALEFLLARSVMNGDAEAGAAVRLTLNAMADGGIYDHLGGGFHRYSTDEAWIVPHFEKMADDNAWLLRNYVHAYAVFGDERYRRVAEGILAFLRDVLSDPAGGFFASQDADVTPTDEGGYFTWTDEEFRRILTVEEYSVLAMHFLHERGAMPHDPEKHVLFSVVAPAEIARRLGRDVAAVDRIIAEGRKKLLATRNRRPAPFIDRTLYTSLNGMLIASCLRASRVLGDLWSREFALVSLDRILREGVSGDGLMHAAGVAAMLDDYVFLVDALVEAYETTGRKEYLSKAGELMQQCISRFSDGAEGGFFDTQTAVLDTRMKRVEDIPHPSANAVAIMVLLRLAAVTGDNGYRKRAEETISIFAGSATEMGVHAGSYYAAALAARATVTLTVEAEPASELAAAARAVVVPATALAYGEDHGRIIPCLNGGCYEPVTEPAALAQTVSNLLTGRTS